MKKTLVGLFTLVALAVGIQVTQAACCPTTTCPSPCDPCAAAPCNPCGAAPASVPCCEMGLTPGSCCGCECGPCSKKKCTWWKIFEDKTCCYKCNNECSSCLSAKRAHWYKFWTDRCVVKNVKCDGCNKPCSTPCEK